MSESKTAANLSQDIRRIMDNENDIGILAKEIVRLSGLVDSLKRQINSLETSQPRRKIGRMTECGKGSR